MSESLEERLRALAASLSDDEGSREALTQAALSQAHRRAVRAVRRCSGCTRTLPLRDFGRNYAQPDGFATACKRCERARDAQRRQNP